MPKTGATLRWRHLVLEMLVAFSLAFLIWLYMHSRAQTTLDQEKIPVQIQLAPGQRELFNMEVVGDPHIIASFSGPSSRLRELKKRLQRGLVKASVVWTVSDEKLNDLSWTESIRVDPTHIEAPPGVHIDLDENSRSCRINLQRMSERVLPVRLEYAGELKVSQIKVEPATVQVRGPQEVLDKAVAISTQPCALEPPSGADPLVRGKVALVSEIDGRPVSVNPKQVNFRCAVVAKQKAYEVTDVPVLFLCPPEFPYRPRFADDKAGKISVRIVGPSSDERPPVLAYVELNGASLSRGRNLEPVRLQLPKDFTLLSNSSPVIAFYLDEIDRGAIRAEPVSRKE
ncbi:MAG: YbbR-like domain-containing protein [Gemmataceae bacterium]